MAQHHMPKLVTRGLSLYLDAANRASYPGSGTTWRDLSGNNLGLSATLTNSPSYSTSNLGYFSFTNASSTWVNTNVTTTALNPNADFTMNCWCYLDPSIVSTSQSIVYYGNFLAFSPNYHWVGIAYSTAAVSFRTFDGTETITSYSIPSIGWYMLTAVRSSTSQLFYAQGSLSSSGTVRSPSISSSATLRLGGNQSLNSSDFYSGRISTFKTYNRALTAAEVLQNFNATRGRFRV